jgi:Tol biopolymer transport system component
LNKAKFGSHFISAFLLISCVALLLISACVPTFELKVTIQNQPLLTLGKIAYINGGDIWIYDLDNSQTTRLTHDGYNSQPQWSEDGERIAFINKGQLYVTNATLYQPQLIDSRPVDWFNWSPDGTYLAYFINNVGIFIWNEASQNKR